MSLRRSLELRAGPLLVLLGRAPRWLPFVVVLGCVVGGLALHGPVAAVLLGIVLLLLALQLFFAWPALDQPARLLRLVVLVLLVVAVVRRF